jgi:YfiH family protein
VADRELVLIEPDWPAPPQVRAVATTRLGGVSAPPWDSLNLGSHVQDAPDAVKSNRQRLVNRLSLPAEPPWLNQVHGIRLVDAAQAAAGLDADGAVALVPGAVCAVQTADCLPVLLCDRDARAVAALHAGWRGLAGGIIEQGVARLAAHGIRAESLLAWLGPAIGPAAYEVGDDVRARFAGAADESAFAPNERGRWQLDLYQLARDRLSAAGVAHCYGGDRCTHTEADFFFSHRRDGRCGRQAALIWLSP